MDKRTAKKFTKQSIGNFVNTASTLAIATGAGLGLPVPEKYKPSFEIQLSRKKPYVKGKWNKIR